MEIEEKEELDSRKYFLKFLDGECDISLTIVVKKSIFSSFSPLFIEPLPRIAIACFPLARVFLSRFMPCSGQ